MYVSIRFMSDYLARYNNHSLPLALWANGKQSRTVTNCPGAVTLVTGSGYLFGLLVPVDALLKSVEKLF